MAESMDSRELFKILKFEEVWGGMTDQDPIYRYDFGNLQLSAAQVMNWSFRPVFLFGGVAVDSNSISEIVFELPLEVESFEQGVAWIANGLGRGFRPRKPCPWLLQGWEWQDRLPWVRELKAYESRPQCTVEREWFKIAVKKLRELASSANESDLAVFRFDGEVLRINACGHLLVMPAQGNAWSEEYSIKAQKLDFLPKRLTGSTIYLGVWEGCMSIGRRRWDLVQNPI